MVSTPNSSGPDRDDDDGLEERDEDPHRDVGADELPAPQGRRAEALEDELLPVRHERDGGEDADLHDRHPEDRGHEVADRIEVLGLEGLGLGDQIRRAATHVHRGEDAVDDLGHGGRALGLGRIGVERDRRRSAARLGRGQRVAVARRDDHHGVDGTRPHRVEHLLLGALDELDALDAGERRSQRRRRRAGVYVGPAELDPEVAGLEDEAEEEDEDQRERQRPEDRRPVAEVASDGRERQSGEGAHRWPRSVADGSAGQREEHVLERRATDRQVGRLDAALLRERQEAADRRPDVAGIEQHLAVVVLQADHGRQRGEVLVGKAVDSVEADRSLVEAAADELVDGPQLEDPAVIHDRDPIAQDLRLLHVVGGQEHGPPVGLQSPDDVPQRPPRGRVEAGRRFVEEDELRVVDESEGDGEALTLTA